jgi:catechol 2,3-dioxygenase-like lactoylglutathione lyase family enzyme
MIDHIGFEVTDLDRTTRFYDAVFRALGARRLLESDHAVAYGINGPLVWFVVRARPPGPGYGHLALQANGKAAVDAAYQAGLGTGGHGDGPPGQRPQYGRRYYAAYLLDPDRLRVEIVSRR